MRCCCWQFSHLNSFVIFQMCRYTQTHIRTLICQPKSNLFESDIFTETHERIYNASTMEWLVDRTTYRHTKCMVCCFCSRRNANTRRGRGEMMDWVTFISKCPRTICLFYRQTQNIQILALPFAENKYIFVATAPVDNQNADSKVKYFRWTSCRFSYIYCWCWFDSWNTEDSVETCRAYCRSKSGIFRFGRA